MRLGEPVERQPPHHAQHDQDTSQRVVELAHQRRRFGSRRIGDLLRAAGAKINDKRVYQLYKLADLSVRKRRDKQRLKSNTGSEIHAAIAGQPALARTALRCGAVPKRSKNSGIDMPG